MPKGGKRDGAGRPLGSKNRSTAEMRSTARMYTDLAMMTLGRVLEKSKSEKNKMVAARELLDRGHGKATQPISGEDGGPVVTRMEIAWQNAPQQGSLAQPNGSPSEFQKSELTNEKKNPASLKS